MTYTDVSYNLTYTTGGVTYTLSGADTTTGLTFRYLGDQGFGLAPLRRITVRGPLQNGDSDIDFRLEPRVLQLPLVIVNPPSTAPRWQHYQIRQKMLNIFRPQTSGVLRVFVSALSGTVVDVLIRYINVKVLGGLSFDVDPDNYHVRTVVQLRADDPTWYEDDGLGTGAPLTATYPSTQISGSGSITITTAGNWVSYPIIRVTGPITLSSITNVTTGEFIDFLGGTTIAAGAYYDIDLTYGQKTVKDNLGVNQISRVISTSNLATWGLVPGANVVRVNGSGITTATNAVFSYFPRYTGI